MDHVRCPLLVLALVACGSHSELAPDGSIADADPGARCAAVAGIMPETSPETALASDAQWLYAIDRGGTLRRAPIDAVDARPSELAQLSGASVYRIRDDEQALWIGSIGTNATLARVDKATGAVEVIARDDLYLLAFAIDDTHVYWAAVGPGEPLVKRRRKDGGQIETVVPRQPSPSPASLQTPRELLVVGTTLFMASESGHVDAPDRYGRIDAVDLLTGELAHVSSTLPEGHVGLIGSLGGELVRIESWAGETTVRTASSELARWSGDGAGALDDTYPELAGDHLYVAVPELERTLVRIPVAGGAPEPLLASHFIGRGEYTGRFVIEGDTAFVFDGEHTIYRVPLAGGPYALCNP